VLAAGLLLAGCVTARGAESDDVRLDDGSKLSGEKKESAEAQAAERCGPEALGDLELLDARTAGPVTCALVTLAREPSSCPVGSDCPSEVLFTGRTNKRGQISVRRAVQAARLIATVDGYAASWIPRATLPGARIVELELWPADGFWLKVLDGEGNYLHDVTITFKQKDDVVAQLRTNELANVFFAQRTPFSGEPVTVEAEGYPPFTVGGQAELGDDGHTLRLKK
jgi:hypothetical protein